TTDVEKLAGATVTVSQLGVKRTVTLGNDGMAVFPGYFVAGEITGSIVKASPTVSNAPPCEIIGNIRYILCL
ncbi:MAG: hypothetical protein N3E48_04510, partial [Candidatus Bathyarchaeota archaeon]|nr:hypothetical protein [Candidatus Bathyarchaeota archaeon]